MNLELLLLFYIDNIEEQVAKGVANTVSMTLWDMSSNFINA